VFYLWPVAVGILDAGRNINSHDGVKLQQAVKPIKQRNFDSEQ
jgi:hypothetical protein